MSDAKQFNVGGVPISVKDEVARQQIGDLSELSTTNKSDIVSAINEAARSGGSPNAVQYTQQSLTDAQKLQARSNIGAAASGAIPSVPAISTDISADATSNTKTASPKAVKDYVDANSGAGAVKYTSQSLTDSQKTQARTNIGAGTYSKPSSGIPASDLASGVVPDVSGFYTKPASGIPASDIASGVIPTVPTISTDVSADAASDIKTSSPKSVKTYVDAGIATMQSDLSDLADEVEAIDIGAYVVAWDGNSEPVVANIPAGVSVTYNTTTYTGTLAASASTIQKIYLVATGTTDNYDRHITVGDSTYSWVNLGTTEITLADYATKTEFSQLEAEVSDLDDGIGTSPIISGASAHDGYVLKKADGTAFTNSYVNTRGVTDFIAVVPGSVLHIVDGGQQPNTSAYALASFYSSNSEASFISSEVLGTAQAVSDYDINIPKSAKYIRITMESYSVPVRYILKTVSQNLSDLNAKVADIDGVIFTKSDGTTGLTVENGGLDASGNLGTAANGRRYVVTNNGYHRITGHGSNYQDNYVIGFYNSDTVSSSTLISGEKAAKSYTDQYFDIIVPSGTKKIVVVYRTESPATPAQFDFYKYNAGDTSALTAQVAENTEEIARIDANIGTMLTFYPSAHDGYSLSKNDGTAVTNAYVTERGVSDFIPVTPGDVFHINKGVSQGATNSYAFLCFYTSDSEESFYGTPILPSQGAVSDKDVVIPPGVNYIRIVLTDYSIPAEGGRTIEEAFDSIGGLIQKNKGKSVVVLGGSHTCRKESEVAKDIWRAKLGMSVYTAGVGSTGLVNYITMYAWEYNGTNVFTRGTYNDGVGSNVWDENGYLSDLKIASIGESSITLNDGNTYARNSADDYEVNTQVALKRLSDASAIDKDIYIIWLSTNDYVQLRPIGNYNDYTEDDNFDTSKIWQSTSQRGTVCGGFNNAVKLIRDAKPDAEIYVFSSLRFFNQNQAGYNPYTTEKIGTNTLNFYDYQREVMKAAQCAGCAILDQFLLQGVDKLNFSAFYQSDNLHLKADGYERIGYIQAEFLANGK